MNPREVELALKKQMLQLRIQGQRAQAIEVLGLVEHGLLPVDRIREGVAWAQHNVPLLTLAGVALLAYRPRMALRWLRRGWRGWRLWRGLRGGAEAALARLVRGR